MLEGTMAKNMILGVFLVIGVVTQVNGKSIRGFDGFGRNNNGNSSPTFPLVRLYHSQVCNKAVDQISRDNEYSKRDDVFVNLVVNVCFPDVDQDTLVELLKILNGEWQDETESTTPVPTEGVPTTEEPDETTAVTTESVSTTNPGNETTTQGLSWSGLLDVLQGLQKWKNLGQNQTESITTVPTDETTAVTTVATTEGVPTTEPDWSDAFDWLFGTEEPDESEEQDETTAVTTEGVPTTEPDWSDTFNWLFGTEEPDESEEPDVTTAVTTEVSEKADEATTVQPDAATTDNPGESDNNEDQDVAALRELLFDILSH